MPKPLIYPIGTTDSCRYAAEQLQRANVSLIDHPSPEVTHLLLDIPSKTETRHLEYVLSTLPDNVTVIGGNLYLPEKQVWDLLRDEQYLCSNAAITAHCALEVALPHLKTILPHTKTLILGWGRIGKCLSRLLKNIGCPITVAVRNSKDRAMLRALGYNVENIHELNPCDFSLIFNTVPEMIFQELSNPEIIKIDLASKSGISAPDVIGARGLPGKLAPVSSGKLIANTILSYLEEEKT